MYFCIVNKIENVSDTIRKYIRKCRTKTVVSRIEYVKHY